MSAACDTCGRDTTEARIVVGAGVVDATSDPALAARDQIRRAAPNASPATVLTVVIVLIINVD
jgi:hypothetical protein